MSDPENFLVRWSRLKRAAALEENGVDEDAPDEALQKAAELPAPAFDPASLPAIDLIDAATDIRPFLEAGVPEELRRAALRSTWSADPAIRDFVGIAESQWDFNDPATIPGFGVRAAAEYAGSLAAHAVGGLNTAVGTPAERSPMGELPASDGTCDDPADVAREVTAAVTDRPDDADLSAPEAPTSKAASFTHGGALPR
jgi:Protein of unknown function (DUF3306)